MSVPFCSIGCVSQRELYPSHPARIWLCFAKSSQPTGTTPKLALLGKNAHGRQRKPRVRHEKQRQFSNPEVGRTPGPRGTPSFRLREYPAMPRAGRAAHNRGVVFRASQSASHPARNWFCSAKSAPTIWHHPQNWLYSAKPPIPTPKLALFRKTASAIPAAPIKSPGKVIE